MEIFITNELGEKEGSKKKTEKTISVANDYSEMNGYNNKNEQRRMNERF